MIRVAPALPIGIGRSAEGLRLDSGRTASASSASRELKFAATRALHIGYEDHGPPDGFPVIMLHGFPDDASTWDRVFPALASAGLRVICPFLRGYGPTRIVSAEFGGGQQAALTRDVLQFADALKLDRFGLVGHDWGCRAATGAAVDSPKRVDWFVAIDGYGLIATRSIGDPAPARLEREYWYQWFFSTDRGARALQNDRIDVCASLQQMWSPSASRVPFTETFESFDNEDFVDVVLHSYRHRHGWAEDVTAFRADEDRLATQPPLLVPTISLLGGEDPLTDNARYRDDRRLFRNLVDEIVVGGAGHFVQRDRPDAVIAAVLRFARPDAANR